MVHLVVLLNFCPQNHLFCGKCYCVLSNKGNGIFWCTTPKRKTILYKEWAIRWGSVWYTSISDERKGKKFWIVILMDFVKFLNLSYNDKLHHKVSYYIIIMVYSKRKSIIVAIHYATSMFDWYLNKRVGIIILFYFQYNKSNSGFAFIIFVDNVLMVVVCVYHFLMKKLIIFCSFLNDLQIEFCTFFCLQNSNMRTDFSYQQYQSWCNANGTFNFRVNLKLKLKLKLN